MHLKWPGFNEKDSVVIELAREDFCLAKTKVDLLGDIFTAKEELHVTLIGSELGVILQDKIKHNKSILQLLEKTFEAIDWSFKQTGPIHVLARLKEGVIEKSIILLIEMHGVTDFYAQLRTLGLTDPETPVPPPHVTLYTQNCALGIGVPGSEVLKRLTIKTLSLNAFSELCESVT